MNSITKKYLSYLIPAFQQKLIVCLMIFLSVFTASLKESHCYPLNLRGSNGRDILTGMEPVSLVFPVPYIIDINLNYVKNSRIDNTKVYVFINKSLIIKIDRPINVLSNIEFPAKRDL